MISLILHSTHTFNPHIHTNTPRRPPTATHQLLYPSRPGINLGGCVTLRGSQLQTVEKDLSGAILLGTRLQGADLSGFDLRGADLSNARLHNVNFTGCRLEGDAAEM